jgi:hypothetical protein
LGGKKALLLRMDPDLYDALVTLARQKDTSLNKLVNRIIREAVARGVADCDYPYPGNPGNEAVAMPRLMEKLSELSELQMESGFDGYTKEEIAQALMNAIGLTTVRQVERTISRLMRDGVLVARLGNGPVRFFINGGKLESHAGAFPAGQTAPAPTPPTTTAGLEPRR